MPAKKKTTLTIKVAGVVADGEGGYFNKGDKFEPGIGCDVDSLKARGLAE